MTSPLPGTSTEVVYRGDTRVWEDLFEENTGTEDSPVWEPLDLSDYTFRCQLRATTESTGVMATIDVELVTDGTDGMVRRTLSHEQAVNLVPGVVYFDFELTDGDGNVHTYLAGKWKVKADVSRAVSP